ncbi:VOC family protein [Olleya namhaensis]|uniref:VOC family protein n=1 Tax=Olleya namhaensis TaxID=1144750 RepID=UPI00248FB224|nr:VOC family protein [Olleya namhaensis]
MGSVSPFHLAIPVHNLEACRMFYRDILNCEEGRSSDHWVDFNFFGHQLVIHFKEKTTTETVANEVDGKHVPVPHFGVVLDWDAFAEFEAHLKTKKINFIIKPYVRFEGLLGEQKTMFFKDPSGNALEFKTFKDNSQLFAK